MSNTNDLPRDEGERTVFNLSEQQAQEMLSRSNYQRKALLHAIEYRLESGEIILSMQRVDGSFVWFQMRGE